MALTAFQSSVLRLLADNRRNNAESYVAGGLALNYKLGTPRVSRDIDVFHDSEAALLRSWESDSATLAENGFAVKLLRKYASFVEADVSKGNDHLEMQWGWDSAYRFFPLQDDPVAGSTLHPLDLATNKLAALVGRTEVRDWIDVITCAQQIQPLAFLFSAACGKDPGFSPVSMLEYVARRRYNQVEIDEKTGVLKRSVAAAKMNPYDLYAIETALQIKEQYAGCVAVALLRRIHHIFRQGVIYGQFRCCERGFLRRGEGTIQDKNDLEQVFHVTLWR